jgi:hypothetical protein
MARTYETKTRGGAIGMLILTVAVVVSVAVIAYLFTRNAAQELHVDLGLPPAAALPGPSPMPNPEPVPMPIGRPG